MAGCTNELYNLIPTVNTCPADTELVLFMNTLGVTGGYAARPWSLVRQCLLSQGLTFVPLQFTIGVGGSPMAAGETQLVITQAGILQDSVNVILGGSVLDRDDSAQISYTLSYASGSVTITFNQAVEDNQTYVITYAYAQ
jgi:hypothetical protein